MGVKAELRILEKLRGPELPSTLELAYRGANLERRVGEPAFDPVEGEEAVFVLGPWIDSNGRRARENLFRPEGGFGARIPLPREGREALLEAVREIVRLQDEVPFDRARTILRGWLQGPNPWLVDVALEQAARFGHASRSWIPVLLERTRDASPWRRARALDAIGLALARGRFDEERSASRERLAEIEEDVAVRELEEQMVSLARGDESEEVRRVAVHWIARTELPGREEILEAIAQDDPSHDVRYEAAAGLLKGGNRPVGARDPR